MNSPQTQTSDSLKRSNYNCLLRIFEWSKLVAGNQTDSLCSRKIDIILANLHTSRLSHKPVSSHQFGTSDNRAEQWLQYSLSATTLGTCRRQHAAARHLVQLQNQHIYYDIIDSNHPKYQDIIDSNYQIYSGQYRIKTLNI